MYAQVEPLKEKPVKTPKSKSSQGKESTKEYEVINNSIEYFSIYNELIVQQRTILLE